LSVRARYYDGRTTQQREVSLTAAGATLSVEGDGVRRSARREELEIAEPLGSAPRRIRFADGAYCESRDAAGLEALLQALGHRDSWVARTQRSWRAALASLALVAALLVAGYLYGLPWAADRVAERLPADVDRALSQRTLDALEQGLLQASTLPAERRTALAQGFAALARPPRTTAAIDLRFASSRLGPNAFALPDGTVVLLDELVALCDHDEQVYGVLAHELGHVHHRHGMRMLLQGSAAGLFAAWWLGDLSGVLAAAPAALLQTRYSRGFEAEADRYAAALLKANGITPARLAEALEKLAAAHGRAAGEDAGWADFLSSHPAPRERLEALRAE
jgi:Zn-dependent protease with chaperone function